MKKIIPTLTCILSSLLFLGSIPVSASPCPECDAAWDGVVLDPGWYNSYKDSLDAYNKYCGENVPNRPEWCNRDDCPSPGVNNQVPIPEHCKSGPPDPTPTPEPEPEPIPDVEGDGALQVQNFCFFPGQPKFGGGECGENESISISLWNTVIMLGSTLASLAVIYAGYLMIFGKEVEGRTLLRRALLGLIALLMASTVTDLVKDSLVAGDIFSFEPLMQALGKVANNLLLPVSGVVAAFFFVVGGYNLLMAGGDSSKVQAGWKYMKNAIFGLAVVLLSFTIVQAVSNLVSIFS